jgi:hypothetical protein
MRSISQFSVPSFHARVVSIREIHVNNVYDKSYDTRSIIEIREDEVPVVDLFVVDRAVPWPVRGPKLCADVSDHGQTSMFSKVVAHRPLTPADPSRFTPRVSRAGPAERAVSLRPCMLDAVLSNLQGGTILSILG